MLEEGYHFVDDDARGHLLDKLGKVGGGLTTDHGSLVVDQQAELLAQLFLNRRGHLLVGSCEETTATDLGSEPVGLCEADCEGDEVLLDLLRREILADLVEGFDGLADISTIVRELRARFGLIPCLGQRAPRSLPDSPEGRVGHGHRLGLLHTRRTRQAPRSKPPGLRPRPRPIL